MTSEIMMKFSRGYDILPTKLSSLHCYRVLTQWIWSRKSPISRYVYQSLLSLICTIRTCVKLSCPYFNIFRNSPYEVLYLYEITAKFSWKWQDCENRGVKNSKNFCNDFETFFRNFEISYGNYFFSGLCSELFLRFWDFLFGILGFFWDFFLLC